MAADEPTHREVALEDALDANAVARVWDRIETERRPRRFTTRSLVFAGLSTAAVAMAIVVSLSRAPANGPVTRTDHAPLVLAPDGQSIALSDGSHVTTAPETELRVIDNTHDRVEWRLARGRARFDVRPHGPRRWHVACAGVSIEVGGTSFVVERRPEHVRVEVIEGVVIVRHATMPDGVRRIERGETVDVRVVEVVTTPAPAPIAPVVIAEEPPLRVDPPAAPDTGALLRDADAARRAGRTDAAIASLAELVRRHPTSHEAPLAAFTLARLEEDRGRLAAAARAYRRAIALGLREPLAGEADARASELTARAADTEAQPE